MSTIVMAIIALLILIVLATMIIRNLGGTNNQINLCANKGGTCSDDSTCADVGFNKIPQPGLVCVDGAGKANGQTCCV